MLKAFIAMLQVINARRKDLRCSTSGRNFGAAFGTTDFAAKRKKIGIHILAQNRTRQLG